MTSSLSLPWKLLRHAVHASGHEVSVPPLPVSLVDQKELVRNLHEGDPEALAQIYDRYAASIFRILDAILGNQADAEDALQEVFAALATGRTGRIRDLKSYLFTSARHQAYTILRRRRREEHWTDVSELQVPAPGDEGGPDWSRLMARLPLEQREVIALKVWEQMTFVEIAAVVKTSPNTVMSRYRYGIEKLRSWCREDDHA